MINFNRMALAGSPSASGFGIGGNGVAVIGNQGPVHLGEIYNPHHGQSAVLTARIGDLKFGRSSAVDPDVIPATEGLVMPALFDTPAFLAEHEGNKDYLFHPNPQKVYENVLRHDTEIDDVWYKGGDGVSFDGNGILAGGMLLADTTYTLSHRKAIVAAGNTYLEFHTSKITEFAIHATYNKKIKAFTLAQRTKLEGMDLEVGTRVEVDIWGSITHLTLVADTKIAEFEPQQGAYRTTKQSLKLAKGSTVAFQGQEHIQVRSSKTVSYNGILIPPKATFLIDRQTGQLISISLFNDQTLSFSQNGIDYDFPGGTTMQIAKDGSLSSARFITWKGRQEIVVDGEVYTNENMMEFEPNGRVRVGRKAA